MWEKQFSQKSAMINMSLFLWPQPGWFIKSCESLLFYGLSELIVFHPTHDQKKYWAVLFALQINCKRYELLWHNRENLRCNTQFSSGQSMLRCCHRKAVWQKYCSLLTMLRRWNTAYRHFLLNCKSVKMNNTFWRLYFKICLLFRNVNEDWLHVNKNVSVCPGVISDKKDECTCVKQCPAQWCLWSAIYIWAS